MYFVQGVFITTRNNYKNCWSHLAFLILCPLHIPYRSLSSGQFSTLCHCSVGVMSIRDQKLSLKFFRDNKTLCPASNLLKTRQGQTRQDKTKSDKTRQGKTRQGKTRQDKAAQAISCLVSCSCILSRLYRSVPRSSPALAPFTLYRLQHLH